MGSVNNFDSVRGNIESTYQLLKSQLANYVTSLQDDLKHISSIEISESKTGFTKLSSALEHEIQSVRSNMTTYFEDLKLQMTQFGQALDLGAAKEEEKCRRLSGIQDREINFEKLSTLALDQGMPEEASMTHSGGQTSRRISVTHEISEFPLNSYSLIAAPSVAASATKIRSGLLDRLSNQLGHLYTEATTPDYEKIKPVQEETVQIMCNEGRFVSDEESKQMRTWINFLFGVGPEDAANGKEQSRLIHPFSYFNTGKTVTYSLNASRFASNRFTPAIFFAKTRSEF